MSIIVLINFWNNFKVQFQTLLISYSSTIQSEKEDSVKMQRLKEQLEKQQQEGKLTTVHKLIVS